jgi:hypothetical protein
VSRGALSLEYALMNASSSIEYAIPAILHAKK